MLRRLRLKLTLLYLLTVLGLMALLGGASYYLLRIYLQNATDQALHVKMAIQFRQYGLNLPIELVHAERDWLGNQNQVLPSQTASQPSSTATYHEDDEYDDELGSVFVVPSNEHALPAPAAIQQPVMIVQDSLASAGALTNGSDLRNSRLSDGRRVRLLTYRNPGSGGPPLLQVGRLLNEQDKILQQFLNGMLVLAAVSAVLLGLGSWWLSGRAIEPAQRAWENQQQFIANASHELRAPLTLIKADAEVGLRSTPSPDQKDILQDILAESDYMNHLVEDLLLLSRLDAGRLKLSHERIDLRALLEETLHQATKLAAGKDVHLSLGLAQGQIWGDPIRMRQVLLILVDNAMRYRTPGGQIRLESRSQDRMVEITVSDNGVGIPAADLPHVFERFYQAPRPAEQGDRSLGLGLSIAHGFVLAQNGQMSIASQVGQGTQVSLKFPELK